MGTETTKIALNAHVNLRTADQHMSRRDRHLDDITDMPRSCRLRENTFGRRPLGSSSRLLKIPNDDDDDDIDDDTPYWDPNSFTPTSRIFPCKIRKKKAVRSEHPHPDVFKYLRYLILLYKSKFFVDFIRTEKKT